MSAFIRSAIFIVCWLWPVLLSGPNPAWLMLSYRRAQQEALHCALCAPFLSLATGAKFLSHPDYPSLSALDLIYAPCGRSASRWRSMRITSTALWRDVLWAPVLPLSPKSIFKRFGSMEIDANCGRDWRDCCAKGNQRGYLQSVYTKVKSNSAEATFATTSKCNFSMRAISLSSRGECAAEQSAFMFHVQSLYVSATASAPLCFQLFTCARESILQFIGLCMPLFVSIFGVSACTTAGGSMQSTPERTQSTLHIAINVKLLVACIWCGRKTTIKFSFSTDKNRSLKFYEIGDQG